MKKTASWWCHWAPRSHHAWGQIYRPGLSVCEQYIFLCCFSQFGFLSLAVNNEHGLSRRLWTWAERPFCCWHLTEMLSAGMSGASNSITLRVLLYFYGWQLVWGKRLRYITSLEHSDNLDGKLSALKTNVLSASIRQQVSGSLEEDSWVETGVTRDMRPLR